MQPIGLKVYLLSIPNLFKGAEMYLYFFPTNPKAISSLENDQNMQGGRCRQQEGSRFKFCF